MLFPQVPKEKWAEIYSIDITDRPCRKCGCNQSFVTPFAYKDFRGLISSHGDCGEEFRQSTFVTVNKEQNFMLGEFVSEYFSSSAAL